MKKRSILLLFIMIVILLPMKTLAMEYKDISESDWYYKDVKELSGKGIIKGYTDGTFKPNIKK